MDTQALLRRYSALADALLGADEAYSAARGVEPAWSPAAGEPRTRRSVRVR